MKKAKLSDAAKRHPNQDPKIGSGHANAMLRQGLSELRASLYTGSNIAQQPEYGLYGHQTPGEIADDRKPDPTQNDPIRSLDEEPTNSPLQQSMREAESRTPDRSPEKSRSKGLDRE